MVYYLLIAVYKSLVALSLALKVVAAFFLMLSICAYERASWVAHRGHRSARIQLAVLEIKTEPLDAKHPPPCEGGRNVSTPLLTD